jgi:hypothetical protein
LTLGFWQQFRCPDFCLGFFDAHRCTDSALPGQYRSRHTFRRSPRFFVALTILFPLTILPIDTNGYIPSQSVDLPIMTKRGRRRIPQSRLVRMIRDEAGWIMPENDCEAVAEFIRTKGITRCPTACVLPTQGLVAAADRIALEEHAIARDQLRRAQTAARWRPF